MPLQLDDLAALDTPAVDASGVPLMLAIDAIDEDADQPRHEFDANALQELADTIRERGVRQPISVRPCLQQSGRWILNFGARRLRAARLAGLAQVPNTGETSDGVYEQATAHLHSLNRVGDGFAEDVRGSSYRSAPTVDRQSSSCSASTAARG